MKPELIILDIMLPDMDGFQCLRKIRESHQTPVIMLTARGEVSDRVVGLELRADDYLPKPFDPRELWQEFIYFEKNTVSGTTC